jgi:hypothetical protein
VSDEKANPYERQVVMPEVRGELTGKEYLGNFRVCVALSQHQILRRGQIYRELLGAYSNNASIEDVAVADRLSELAVRVVDAPQWWATSMNGLELRDSAPVETLAKAVHAAVAEYEKEIAAQASAARADLKK